MNEIQERKIDEWLHRIVRCWETGWGKHELHDRLCELLDYIDTVLPPQERKKHLSFRMTDGVDKK